MTKIVETEVQAKSTKSTKKRASAVKSNTVIQFAGESFSVNDIVAKVKAVNEGAKKIDIYVKPEEKMVYFVADGETEGKIEL